MNNLTEIKSFLKKVYPCLKENSFNYYAGEIRFISRKGQYKHGFNIWRIDDCIEKNLPKLNSAINENYCTYYSGFLIDTDIAKRASNKAAIKTHILPIDFDLSKDEFLKEKHKLNNLGIETLDVFTGHGYQSLILLKEEVYDKLIYEKFTSLLINKGFKADASIKDCARILRLPYTINNKYEPVKTYIFNDTDKRYSLSDVFKLIQTLPDANECNINNNITDDCFNSLTIKTDFQKIYGYYNNITFPEHIQKMFIYSKPKYRNNTFVFLSHFLIDIMNIHISVAEELLIKFHIHFFKSDKKHAIKEFLRIIKYKINLKKFYDENLKELYGVFLNLDNYMNETIIKIPRIKNLLYINENALLMYYKIAELANFNNNCEFTREEILRYLDISVTSFYKSIKILIDNKLILKEKSNKSSNLYIYKLQNFNNMAKTPIKKSYFKTLIQRLNGLEFKIYFILKEIIGKDSYCYPSQAYIADKVKKDRTTVTKAISKLVEKRFIRKVQYTLLSDKKLKYNKYELIY